MGKGRKMKDDDILELAKDAWRNGQWRFSDRGLIQFARAIAERERDACAMVCDDRSMRCEKEAQEVIINGEYEEVSYIRSTAWQISICAASIRARGEK